MHNPDNTRIRTVNGRPGVLVSAVMLLLTLATACTKQPGAQSQEKNGEQQDDNGSKQQSKLKPFTPPETVELKNVTPQGLADFIAGQKGRAVVVDYWATWCAPCKVAFPHTVKLSREYADDGLVVVSMCVDTPDSRPPAVSFLKQQNARIVNFFADPALDLKPAAIAEAFNVSTFPSYRVYGPDGELVQEVTPEGVSSFEEFQNRLDAVVEEALGL